MNDRQYFVSLLVMAMILTGIGLVGVGYAYTLGKSDRSYVECKQ